MNKLNRILWSGLALGLVACGDDVTVQEPTPGPTPGIASVTVAPDGATIAVNGTVQLSAGYSLDPGATGTPTIAWSSGNTAVATVNATSGLVTGVTAGSVGITATATLGTSTAKGVAGVTVLAAPTCAITGVAVTPGTADLVVNQGLQFAATVTGTNCVTGDLTVTWSIVGSPAGATISAAGLFTATAAGNYVVRATSVKNNAFTNTAAVTVIVPTPATVSIQSITQYATNVPVDLTNVGGQIEITLNIDPGSAPTITRAQALIDGVVVAEQCYASQTVCDSPAASASESPQAATQVLILSTNTRQVKKVNNLFIPVVFNGHAFVTARVYVAGQTAPAVSNAIPVRMNNQDASLPATGFAVTTPVPSAVDSGTTWYTGGVALSGINFVNFSTVAPTFVVDESCNDTNGAAITTNAGGSAATGWSLTATSVCVSPWEAGVTATQAFAVAYSAAQGPDATIPAFDGVWSAVTSSYKVNGDDRWNLVTGAAATGLSTLYIDNKAPNQSWNEIGYLNGCSAVTVPDPGCWVKSDYAFSSDFVTGDNGSGMGTEEFYNDYGGSPIGCSATAVTTGADYAETPAKDNYRVCGVAKDRLGNSTGAIAGPNNFSTDFTAPTIAYAAAGAGIYSADTLSDSIPVAVFRNYKFQDTNSGLDSLLAVKFATTGTTINDLPATCVPSMNPALAAVPVIPSDPRSLLVGVAPDFGCGDPGYYYLGTRVEDRAGNTSSTITRKFGFEPGVPDVVAINRNPLYGGTLPASVDVFLGHTGASLQDATLGIWYNKGTAQAAGLFYRPSVTLNAPWAVPLYLGTLAGGQNITIPGTATLSGLVLDSTVAPATSFDSLSVALRDVCQGTCLRRVSAPLAHWDTSAVDVPASFKNLTKNSVSTTVWATPKLGSVAFSGTGACTVSYETLTNGPTIPTAAWVVDLTGGNKYTLIQSLGGNPTLVSDNGTIRKYQYSVSSATCASLGGTLKLLAVKNDAGGLPVGYIVP